MYSTLILSDKLQHKHILTYGQSCRNYRERWNAKIFCTDFSANFYFILGQSILGTSFICNLLYHKKDCWEKITYSKQFLLIACDCQWNPDAAKDMQYSRCHAMISVVAYFVLSLEEKVNNYTIASPLFRQKRLMVKRRRTKLICRYLA